MGNKKETPLRISNRPESLTVSDRLRRNQPGGITSGLVLTFIRPATILAGCLSGSAIPTARLPYRKTDSPCPCQ